MSARTIAHFRLVVLALPIALAGCGGARGVESDYGRSLGKSVNGTGVFARMLRDRGHEVRAATRLDDRLENRADVLIRFTPYPGPPSREEAEWYAAWMMANSNRRLVLVLRDYDAEHDYWVAARAALDASASDDLKERLDHQVQASRGETLPPAPQELGDPELWFSMDPKEGSADPCRTLAGPWAEGIDAPKAGLVARRVPAATVEGVLLAGDDRVLAMEWGLMTEEPRVIVVANGSFLLNAALLNHERRPLAGRLAEWIGDPSRRIVFVEGSNLMGQKSAGGFHLTRSMTWVMAHLAAFGLLGALALATRLGPPRPDEPTGAERPVAHAEALGDLLANSRDAALARTQLEAYRRWRQPTAFPNSRS